MSLELSVVIRALQRWSRCKGRAHGSSLGDGGLLLADGRHRVMGYLRILAVVVLPTELVVLHHHDTTVVGVSWLMIGFVGAPVG